MVHRVAKWLRDGGENEAADLIEQCSLSNYYVDTAFELAGGDRAYDFFDVNVEAPRRVHIAISGEANQLCHQIESAIRDCARSDSVYVRDIHWVPLATSAASAKDDWFTETLSQVDSDHVQRFWKKALERKDSDHDGAITAARSLLESVCKHILDASCATYDSKDNLPKLFHATLECMSLAPNQQTDQLLRKLFGNCQSIINAIASVRNELGDAHGKSDACPSTDKLHAELMVNLAGSLTTFLIRQWENQRGNAPVSQIPES
jgi:Abortive infection C-terminus